MNLPKINERFEVGSGTIIGRSHRMIGKNNQDSLAICQAERFIVAVVCDGCSEGENSEIGAKLGAKFLLDAITKEIIEKKNSEQRLNTTFWERVQFNVLNQISMIAYLLGGNFAKAINDYFLFTALGFMIFESDTEIFGVGDGLIVINGEKIQLGPFENNQPPYISYNLFVSNAEKKERNQIKTIKTFPTLMLDTLFIGTDGCLDLINAENKNFPGKNEVVGPVGQFFQKEKYFKNPDAIRRFLHLVNSDITKLEENEPEQKELRKYNGLLTDDTTFIIARPKRKGG